jgi:hypothetical protein
MHGQIEQRGLSPFETAALRLPQGDGSDTGDLKNKKRKSNP